MCKADRICSCTQWNLYSMRKNPRIFCGFLLGFCLCYFLMQRIMECSMLFHTDIQIFELFIWCFADSDSILFVSLAILLFLFQIPRLDTPAYYLIFRKGKMDWLLGQVLTSVLISLAYTMFLLGSSMLLALGGSNVVWGDQWSDTATILSFAPENFEVALTVVRKTIKLTTPYDCAATIFFLMAQYILFLTLLNLIFSLISGKKAGIVAVIVVSLYAYLLNPDKLTALLHVPEEVRDVANVIAAWISPLNHATYAMHRFGYGDFPSILQSHMVFGIINLGLLLGAWFSVKKTERIFLGGSHD